MEWDDPHFLRIQSCRSLKAGTHLSCRLVRLPCSFSGIFSQELWAAAAPYQCFWRPQKPPGLSSHGFHTGVRKRESGASLLGPPQPSRAFHPLVLLFPAPGLSSGFCDAKYPGAETFSVESHGVSRVSFQALCLGAVPRCHKHCILLLLFIFGRLLLIYLASTGISWLLISTGNCLNQRMYLCTSLVWPIAPNKELIFI